MNAELFHYGIKRRSGRYPWGSGERPYQRNEIKGNYKIESKKSATKELVKGNTISILESIGIRAATFIPVAGPFIAMGWNTYILSKQAYKLANRMTTTNYQKREGEFGKISDLDKKKRKMSIEADMSKVNPRGIRKKGRVQNCVNCVQAMELRRRGYDVQARSADTGSLYDYNGRFQNAKTKTYSPERREQESKKEYFNRHYNDVMNDIEKYGEGSRGAFSLFYDQKLGQSAGHTMFWEVKNGKVRLLDPQSGSEKTAQDCIALSEINSWMVTRLDNLKLKENITEAVMNIKEKK